MKDLLHELLAYRNGELTWKVRRSNGVQVGDSAGCLNHDGRIYVKVHGNRYSRHRLVWVMHYGNIPKGITIDHIDRDKSNDRIENLRLATDSQNKHNVDARGYCWHKPMGKWRAKITDQGETIHLGYFDCQIDARAEYLRAKRKVAGEFAPV